MSQKIRKRFIFTPTEDKLLLQLVSKHGNHAWDEISKYMFERTPKQCRNRFHTYLSPPKNRHPWTIEEDDKLTDFVHTKGIHFQDFIEHFPGRTVSCLKNRWYHHLSGREKKTKQSETEENQVKSNHQNDPFPELFSEQYFFHELFK